MEEQLITTYFFPHSIKEAEGNCCKQQHGAKNHGPPDCPSCYACLVEELDALV